MKATERKEVFARLLQEAEMVAESAWKISERADNGENIAAGVIAEIKNQAAKIMAGAVNKTQAKKLNSVMSSAIYCLKLC